MRGGLTKAVLTRANTLIKSYENVIFLTLSFQPDFNKIIEQLYDTGKLDKKVKVLNFHDDLAKMINPEQIIQQGKETNETKVEGFYEFIDKGNEFPSYRYYKDGKYVKYKRFNQDGSLLFVDYMNDSRQRTQRDEYDEEGCLVCSQFMDPTTNKARLKSYYGKNGECYLSTWVDDDKKEGRSLLFGPNYKEYKTLYHLYTKWVDEKLKSLENPVVFSDSRFSDGLVMDLKTKNIKKIAVLHNNHFARPYNNKADIKKTWNPLFNGIEKFDRVVFLTNDQRQDIASVVGDLQSFRVIPHAVPTINEESKASKHKPHLAVYLARYETQKRVDEAIKAFKYVVKKLPDARLHIYGFGPLKSTLNNKIIELKLENNVKLMDFTDNPTKTYQEAACSLLTSDYEGFGMVITESLAAGTPVVAYDCKYGPKDIIRDGKDGFLVPWGNRRKLANRILQIFKDQELRKELSRNAVEVKERFSRQKYEEKWIEIIRD